jgi:hypothetical protein
MDKITPALKWLREQAEKEKYGEVSLKLIIHEGIVKRVEKCVVEKEQ